MELGFGLYRFREGGDSLLRTYLQRGGKIVDGAPNYFNGQAHALIANSSEAKASMQQLCVWSKVGFHGTHALQRKIAAGVIDKDDVVENHALTPKLIRAQLDETRVELTGMQLDALYLHNPERQLLRLGQNQFWSLMSECVDELEEACAKGQIRRWGISVWDGFRGAQESSSFLLSEWESTATSVAGNSHNFSLVQVPLSLGCAAPIADLLNNQRGVIHEATCLHKVLVASSPKSLDKE
jgi:aryl-alcohol dehydrogenase-like predicted oxidoreductase